MFDDSAERIPRGLDEMEPGVHLAAFLSTIDVGRLSGHDRVVVLRAHQRMASYYQARLYEDMASIADCLQTDDDLELATEAAAAEIRAALRLTRRAADTELAMALDLKRRLPRVWEALAKGDIDVRRARTIAYGTAHLAPETARRVVDGLIEGATRRTTGQLAAQIRRLCIEVDPVEARERYETTVAGRRLVCEPTTSGTADLLGLDLPPDRVAAVSRRIARLARSLKAAGESRTMDQLRADVFLDLLEGRNHSDPRTRAVVDVRVDLATLTGLAEHPGELAGYGPVVADIARRVAARQQRSEWRYTVTDPETGRSLHTGTIRRRPTAGQRRGVEALDTTCVFPGCRMPAAGCDLDHTIPWSRGGPTALNNLVPLCRHDHRIRHEAGWTHRTLPDGDHRWTSGLGHTYTTSGKPP